MIRVFIDTNVVLVFLLEREPFVEDAVKLFAKIDAGEIAGFIAATTITNIYYIIRKAAGVKVAEDAISQILSDLHICAVDKNVLQQAISLNFKDFEDAVQYACAMISTVDVIVTRDVSGFVGSEIPVMLAGDLCNISSE
ncbi:PIN domain-containing protein [Nodularia spumigena CS-586/05]|uniref:type II toxin-antitoxin system VapC family toxin n=1 Tax=Nodularia spumigena TaxID=70799 RepID=UPI00232B827A|nr:PIN domain-containing protein [Nodularia spumigena]MDB9345771.1 PIN domain-containing protein [Nodularia spumigena CS-588/06]MDB9369886.1 PIN domain-containing protein [Nodularia spumigena CS-586/05]